MTDLDPAAIMADAKSMTRMLRNFGGAMPPQRYDEAADLLDRLAAALAAERDAHQQTRAQLRASSRNEAAGAEREVHLRADFAVEREKVRQTVVLAREWIDCGSLGADHGRELLIRLAALAGEGGKAEQPQPAPPEPDDRCFGCGEPLDDGPHGAGVCV